MQMCINSRNRGVNQNTFAFLRAATVFFSSLARTICSHLQRFFCIPFRRYFIVYSLKFFLFKLLVRLFFFLKSKALPIYPNSILLLQGSVETLLIFGYVQSIVQNPLEMDGAQHACEFRVNAEKGNQYDTLCIHMFLLYGNRME